MHGTSLLQLGAAAAFARFIWAACLRQGWARFASLTAMRGDVLRLSVSLSQLPAFATDAAFCLCIICIHCARGM